MRKPRSTSKQGKSITVVSQRGGRAVKADRKQQKELTDFDRYIALREPADKALVNRDYETARLLYLKAVRQIDKLMLKGRNWKCHMFAGAGASAFRSLKISSCIRYLSSAFDELDDRDEGFVSIVTYLVDILQWLPYYIKTPMQRRELNKLQQSVFEEHKGKIDKFSIPEQPRKTSSYKVHGETITDDFAYLEDLDAPQTVEWLAKQQEYSSAILQFALLNYELPGEYYRESRWQPQLLPFKCGKYYYFRHIERSSSQRVVSRSETVNGRRVQVFAEQDLQASGMTVVGERITTDGKFIVYGMSNGGSDWEEWRVRDVKRRRDVPGFKLRIHSGSIMLHPNGKGVLYWKQSAPKRNEDRLRRIDEDVRIFYRPFDKKDGREKLLYKPEDRRVESAGIVYLGTEAILIQERRNGERYSRFYVRSETARRKKLIPLFGKRPSNSFYIGRKDLSIYLVSYENAKNGKIICVEIDSDTQTVASVKTVVPECSDRMIREADFLKHRIVVHYLVDCSTKSHLVTFNHEGQDSRIIELPFDGLIGSINASYHDNNVFFSLSNFANAATHYRYNLQSRITSVVDVPTGSPCKDLKMEVVKVKGKDGSVVPMWLVYSGSLKPNPQTPTLMYVYGGFNVSQIPYCHYEIISWCEMGGIWAQPYLRGGGELGADWHAQARKLGKQTTFDDAIACAEFLVRNKYTSPAKLAVKGGSNGGLTVAAVINQAPHLFGAAVTSNGLFDMLKFHKHTIGWSWQSEYGNITKIDEYNAIRSYSPYHNLRKYKEFPALMLCTDSADDRVPPWHTYKYLAQVRSFGYKRKPILLRVEPNTGHANRKSNWEIRDQQAFLKLVLGF
jgi:prolyl oligopeptidase